MATSAPVTSEIERLSRDLQVLEEEISAATLRSRPSYRPGRSLTPCDSPPRLTPFGPSLPHGNHSTKPDEQSETRVVKRKEIEARRYSGKEPVTEYLLQFELTARRNAWSEKEKATSLLCALDGPARGILAEVDIDVATYDEVKNLLLKRFGPVLLSEVHEQALQDLKLARNQPIRELTTEVSRLVKLAYPDFNGAARERFAVKALINAIHDRDTIFYVKEKDPRSMDEVRVLYERYKVLTGNAAACKPPMVKGVKPADEPTQNPPVDSLIKQTEAHSRQLAQLTASIEKLLQQQQQQLIPAPMLPSQPHPGYSSELPRSDLPRKPCPRCKQPGHWARDCPQPETCFRCGQPGHRRADCRAPLNTLGPTSAPHAGPQAPHPY